MPLTSIERAEVLLHYLNDDKPHGLSAADFAKDNPDPYLSKFKKGKPKKTKGIPISGSDSTVNYGYRPEYDPYYTDRHPTMPNTTGLLPSIGQGVVTTDSDLVYTMYGMLSNKSRNDIDKILSKRGKEGYIQDARPTLPIVQDVGFVEPSDKLKDILLTDSDLTSDHKVLLKDPSVKKKYAGKYKTSRSSTKKDGTPRKTNPNIGIKGKENMEKYQAIANRLRNEDFFKQLLPGTKRSAISVIYELLKEKGIKMC